MTEAPNTQLVKTNGSKDRYLQIKQYARSDDMLARFEEVLGSRREASAYISSVLLAVANNQALMNCSPASIMTSAMRAATLRISCDPSLGHAYIIPFKDKATFVIGYKGLHFMAIRTGKYRYINVATIVEGQEVEEDQLRGVHTIIGKKVPGAKPKGYMLYFELYTGYSKTFYMTVDEILAHAQKYSKSWNRSDSAWKTHLPDMCKKTVMRLGLSKWGYLDPTDQMILSGLDENGADDGESIDAASVEYVDDAEPMSAAQAMADLYGDPEPEPEPAVEQMRTIELVLVEAGVFPDEVSAASALEGCSLKVDAPDEAWIAWGKRYMGWIELGANHKSASEKANKGQVPA